MTKDEFYEEILWYNKVYKIGLLSTRDISLRVTI